MANRAANLAVLNQGFDAITNLAGFLRQQKEAEAAREQQKALLDLRIQQQKILTDQHKFEKNKLDTEERFRQAFFDKLQNPSAPAQPLSPTGQEAGSPMGSALAANQQSIAAGQQGVDPQVNAMQLLALASQGGVTPVFGQAAAQGLIATPAQSLQQRAREANLQIQEQQVKEVEAVERTRQKMSEALAQRAGQLKGQDKDRFNLAALAMQTAAPNQMIAMLNQLYPQVEEPSTPFQALIRLGKSPTEALKILGDIEVQNKLRLASGKPASPRSYGVDREAEASAKFDGKSFAELTPDQQKEVNEAVVTKQIRINQQSVKDLPLPVDARKELSVLKALSESVRDLQQAFRPEFVGKARFIGNKIRIATGQASPELTAFASLHENLIDQLARERTGAVIGKEEAAQFRRIIGSQFDEPATFLARLEQFSKTLARQEGVIFDLNLKTASELNAERKGQAQTQAASPTTDSGPANPLMQMSDDDLLKLHQQLLQSR